MTNTNSRYASQEERSKHSVSLESFGAKKGQIRALEEFRNRKLRKRMDTAKALRKYKKLMKQEGMEAGQGAARKRGPAEDHDEKAAAERGGDRKLRHQKSNPFAKSLGRAADKKVRVEEAQKSREENERERRKKLSQRKRETKLLSQRTKKGQPIMKHTVNKLLAKLQR